MTWLSIILSSQIGPPGYNKLTTIRSSDEARCCRLCARITRNVTQTGVSLLPHMQARRLGAGGETTVLSVCVSES